MKVTNETKVGALAAVSIALLILGYNFLRGNKLFSDEKTYYAIYDKVDGMKLSSFVQLHGLNIGRVMDLQLNEEGKIVSTLVLSGKVQIPRNTVARIVNVGILGDKVIRLEFSNSKEYFLDGDTLVAAMGENLSEGVIKEIAPVKAKAEAVLVSIDSVLLLLKKTFNERTRSHLEASIKNLSQTTSQMNTLISNESARLDKILANIESISGNLNKSNKEITTILSNASAITDSVRRADIVQTIHDAHQAISAFATITDKINKGQGSLGLLVNDEKLYTHLDSTASNLNQLLVNLREHPSKYVHFSLFGKKDKQQQK